MDVLVIEAPAFAPNHLSAEGPRSEPVTQAEADRVRAVLREGWGVVVQGVRRFKTGGTTASNYLLDETLVLKWRADGETLAREVARVRRAQEFGVPVPACRLASDGAPVFRWRAASCALFDYVPGTHFRGGSGEIGAAAEVFASVARAFADETAAPALDWNTVGGRVRTALELSPKIADPAAEKILRATSSRLEDSLEENDGVELDRLATIHTDMHPLNLLFAQGRVAAVLDFEDVAAAPRAVGAGFALLKLGREALSRVAPADRRGLARALVEEWRSTDSTSADLLASGARRRVLANIAEILDAWRRDGNISMNHGLAGQIESLAEVDFLFDRRIA